MDQETARRRASEERAKATTVKSEFARNMHLQLAEQFARRAEWPQRERRGD
jgi:hypothetical protein